MLEDQDYLEAIENDNPNEIHFEKQLVSVVSDKCITDFRFEDGVVIRETCMFQSVGINFGNQLKRRVEFIEPVTRKLRPDEMYED